MPAKGQKLTEEQRRRMSEAKKRYFEDHPIAVELARQRQLKRWQDPEFRRRVTENQPCQPHSKETLAKISAANKGKPLSAECKAKISAKAKERWQNAELRKKYSAAHTERWQDSEFRQKVVTSLTGHRHSDESRRKMSENQRHGPLPPEQILKLREAGKRLWQDPEYVAKIQARLEEYRKTPEAAAHMAALRAACLKTIRNTSIERAVGAVLTALGIPFEPSWQIGCYEVDFYLTQCRIVLECDGDYWHGTAQRQAKDRARDNWLRRQGYTVVRLTETEIKADAEAAVRRALGSATS